MLVGNFSATSQDSVNDFWGRTSLIVTGLQGQARRLAFICTRVTVKLKVK